MKPDSLPVDFPPHVLPALYLIGAALIAAIVLLAMVNLEDKK